MTLKTSTLRVEMFGAKTKNCVLGPIFRGHGYGGFIANSCFFLKFGHKYTIFGHKYTIFGHKYTIFGHKYTIFFS